MAAIYTVESFDPSLVSEGDWNRVKSYFLTQIEAERVRLESYGDTDDRREMRIEEKLVFDTIMGRWLTCGWRSGPERIAQIGKEMGLKNYRL